jgi:hypothetical protein
MAKRSPARPDYRRSTLATPAYLAPRRNDYLRSVMDSMSSTCSPCIAVGQTFIHLAKQQMPEKLVLPIDSYS